MGRHWSTCGRLECCYRLNPAGQSQWWQGPEVSTADLQAAAHGPVASQSSGPMRAAGALEAFSVETVRKFPCSRRRHIDCDELKANRQTRSGWQVRPNNFPCFSRYYAVDYCIAQRLVISSSARARASLAIAPPVPVHKTDRPPRCSNSDTQPISSTPHPKTRLGSGAPHSLSDKGLQPYSCRLPLVSKGETQ